jgi:hypothetical protein
MGTPWPEQDRATTAQTLVLLLMVFQLSVLGAVECERFYCAVILPVSITFFHRADSSDW